MNKILIAGLPSAGKSTYIAALAYTLKETNGNLIYKMNGLPKDLSIIRNLYIPWLNQNIVDRTALGTVSNISLNLVKQDQEIILSLPDIAGEDFEQLLRGKNDIIKTWSKDSDGLLFLIKDLPSEVLADSFNAEKVNTAVQPPIFDISNVSKQVKNLLLIKELHKNYNFKKIAIGLSAWDLNENIDNTPESYLKECFPVFYNYIRHYYSDIFIFGLSAQGAEYKEENRDSIEERTSNGTRAYIVSTKEMKYDLTIPIDYLID